MKVCTRCGFPKKLSEFHKDPRMRDGHLSWCKKCHSEQGKIRNKRYYDADPQRAIAKSRAWRLDNPDKYKETKQRYAKNNSEKIKLDKRNRNLRKKYGISAQDFDEMVERQGGCCAICRKPPSGRWGQLVVDHSHSTGQVRGLLCNQCNSALGFLKDDPETLDRAIRYMSGVLYFLPTVLM